MIVVEKQYERVPIVPIVKDDVMPTPSHINTIWEADEAEAPAFRMG